jgi:sucrose-6-phosphate hydrolase SacC (GH32 family)
MENRMKKVNLTRLLVVSICCFITAGYAVSSIAKEAFRPQFHFTPEKNWMNDPNGMVYYNGEYHLFYQYNPEGDRWGHMSWGHAVSPDLVHWERLPLALPEKDGIMIFSGSAVVDWDNTSGFGKKGKPPLVAIYTGHREGHQDQRLAYSTDRGRTWTQYKDNPVLDINLADFRDPKVFWHEPSQQWVMVLALSVQKKVALYGSPDLKTWAKLSEFGPAGCTDGIWECPDLFQLPIEGETDVEKWVLIVNLNPGGPAGGSGCQYFVGEFDGIRFTDESSLTAQKNGDDASPSNEQIIDDFEGGSFAGWKIAGTAFNRGPQLAAGDSTGFVGSQVADSFGTSDSDEGSLTSPEFTIDHNVLSFRIGGGSHLGKMGINLIVDGNNVRTATGNNSPSLEMQSWNIREFRGQTAQVELFDRYSGNDWGHIIIDHIVLCDEVPASAGKDALWADFGSDFYAGVSWSDIPAADGRRIWIGWMSNWLYGETTPTSPFRSAMTVPRSLTLHRTPDGLRLAQKPVAEMAKLYDGPALKFPGGTFAEANAWLAKQKDLPMLLAVKMSFAGQQPFTITVETGPGEETAIICDPDVGKITVDRTRSGLTDFHDRFSGRHEAPLRIADDAFDLCLLLDTSSIEVFAQKGETVLTDLIFPGTDYRRLNLSADGGDGPAVRGITIQSLKSIW